VWVGTSIELDEYCWRADVLRPLDLSWVRDLRDRRGETALFFKQVGGRTPKAAGRLLDGRTWDEYPSVDWGVVYA